MTVHSRSLTLAAVTLSFAFFFGMGCGDPNASDDDVVREEAALAATGGDFPGSKCVRNNKDGSSTSGKCEDVCKDKTVYSPHPSEDPPGTAGICYEAARKAITHGRSVSAVSSATLVKAAK